MTDSGALLETCAGSGVTMVAIVGGFLLTKYLSIATDIAAAENELTDLDHRLDIERREHDALRHRYDVDIIEDDLDEPAAAELFIGAARDVVGHPDGVTLDELRSAFTDIADRSTKALTDVLQRWNAEARRVVEHGIFTTLKVSTQQPSWTTFKRNLPSDVVVEDMWKVEFEHRRSRLVTRSYERQPDTTMGRLAAMAARGHTLAGVGASALRLSNADGWRARWSRVEDAAEVVATLEAQRAVAQERRNRIAQPDGVISGFIYLAIVFVLTVVPSMLLLTPEPANLDRTAGGVVVGVYFVGVMVMFVYFGNTARKLLVAGRPPLSSVVGSGQPGPAGTGSA